MDISGSKSELSKRWRVWLRGFTYFAKGKANQQNPARKKSELLYRAGSGVQDIFENLTIVPLFFHVQENAAYERHVLWREEPGEDVDLFVLQLRKQARHCGYEVEELEFAVRDQLLEKVSSQELWNKLFEVPNIQLAAALTTARAWETACRQAIKIAGEEEKRSVNLVQHRASKEKPSRQGMHKCYACGRSGHFVRVCALRRERCVLSVARKATGQRVARMRQMENGKWVRGLEEQVGVIFGDPVVLPVEVI